MTRVGIVRVNTKYLARVLGHKDAQVRDIKMLNSTGYNMVEVLIEDESLPEQYDGNYIAIVDEVICK